MIRKKYKMVKKYQLYEKKFDDKTKCQMIRKNKMIKTSDYKKKFHIMRKCFR